MGRPRRPDSQWKQLLALSSLSMVLGLAWASGPPPRRGDDGSATTTAVDSWPDLSIGFNMPSPKYPRPLAELSIQERDDICNDYFPGRYSQICAPSMTLCCIIPNATAPQCVTLLGQGFCCTEHDSCFVDSVSQCAASGSVACNDNACCPALTSCDTAYNQTKQLVRCNINQELVPQLNATGSSSSSSSSSTSSSKTVSGTTKSTSSATSASGSATTTSGRTVASTFISGTVIIPGYTDSRTTVGPITLSNTFVPLVAGQTYSTSSAPSSSFPSTSTSSTSLSGGAIAGIVIGALVLIAAAILVCYFLLARRRRSKRNAANAIHEKPPVVHPPSWFEPGGVRPNPTSSPPPTHNGGYDRLSQHPTPLELAADERDRASELESASMIGTRTELPMPQEGGAGSGMGGAGAVTGLRNGPGSPLARKPSYPSGYAEMDGLTGPKSDGPLPDHFH